MNKVRRPLDDSNQYYLCSKRNTGVPKEDLCHIFDHRWKIAFSSKNSAHATRGRLTRLTQTDTLRASRRMQSLQTSTPARSWLDARRSMPMPGTVGTATPTGRVVSTIWVKLSSSRIRKA